MSYINYNWMPTVAHHGLDYSERYYRKHGVSRLHNFGSIDPKAVRRDDIIFVKTDEVHNRNFERKILPHIQETFTLVTGVSSKSLRLESPPVLANQFLKYWFCTNPPVTDDPKMIPLPIGFQEKERRGGNQEILRTHNQNQLKWPSKLDKLYLPYHTPKTNPKRARQINYLRSLDFVEAETKKLSFIAYLEKMNKYKFVICLPGSGNDTHRNYEALLVGSVPVMIKGPIKRVYDFDNLPSVFVDNIDQITDSIIGDEYSFDTVQDFLSIDFHKKRILEYASR